LRQDLVFSASAYHHKNLLYTFSFQKQKI
jgi:hypothetical protein